MVIVFLDNLAEHILLELLIESKTYVYKIADESGMKFVGGNKYTYTISLSGGNLVVVSVKIEEWKNNDISGTADLQ